MKYYQYFNNLKNIFWYKLYTNLAYVTPYVQESKNIQVPIINKYERKLLACKNGLESTVWSWNDSPGTLMSSCGKCL